MNEKMEIVTLENDSLHAFQSEIVENMESSSI